MAAQPQLTFSQIDATTEQVVRRYVWTTTKGADGIVVSRLDEISGVHPPPTHSQQPLKFLPDQRSFLPAILATYLSATIGYLKILFLPTGFPHSVTPDYTPYQIYDSIQAFASTIASLLSSRAVLQSLNVISSASPSSTNESDDEVSLGSTEAATAATLLAILQSTLSNLTTILFASRAAPRISPDVKFYRFLADVVNDIAFVLDLLAPSLSTSFDLGPLSPLTSSLWPLLPLPVTPRVLALCTSSMLRAVCGVAGGSSKAVLSAHFARSNPENVGELNAKDGSQETVINLLGMWVGGVVVSRVDAVATTWIWMLALLGIHLWANYQAVRSIRLRGLNRERAAIVAGEILDGRAGWADRIGFENVGSKESVLGVAGVSLRMWRRLTGKIECADWRTWSLGVTVDELFRSICPSQISTRRPSGALHLCDNMGGNVSALLHEFEEEQYILWVDPSTQKPTIAFKLGITPRIQFKACLHAALAQRNVCEARRQSGSAKEVILSIEESRRHVNERWDELCRSLERAGWELDSVYLEEGATSRIAIDMD